MPISKSLKESIFDQDFRNAVEQEGRNVSFGDIFGDVMFRLFGVNVLDITGSATGDGHPGTLQRTPGETEGITKNV